LPIGAPSISAISVRLMYEQAAARRARVLDEAAFEGDGASP
jgi:hypothetical protein